MPGYPRPSILARIHFISVVDHHLLLTHAAGILPGNIERQISSTQLDVLIPERTRMDQGISRVGPTIAGWWCTYPSDKYESQLGSLFPMYGKITNAPNLQPDRFKTSKPVLLRWMYFLTLLSLSRHMSECFRGPSQSHHSMSEE